MAARLPADCWRIFCVTPSSALSNMGVHEAGSLATNFLAWRDRVIRVATCVVVVSLTLEVSRLLFVQYEDIDSGENSTAAGNESYSYDSPLATLGYRRNLQDDRRNLQDDPAAVAITVAELENRWDTSYVSRVISFLPAAFGVREVTTLGGYYCTVVRENYRVW
jgi:hypothetical protein